MKCLKPGCDADAIGGSNYCTRHQPGMTEAENDIRERYVRLSTDILASEGRKCAIPLAGTAASAVMHAMAARLDALYFGIEAAAGEVVHPPTTCTRVLIMAGQSPRLEAVLPLIERHRALLPTWCHELLVRGGDETDCPLSVSIDLQYHFATLSVHGSYWTDTDEMREESLRHELTHLLLAPLDDFGRDLFDHFVAPQVEAGTLTKAQVTWMREQYKQALESTTVDLTRAMGQLDNPRLTRTLPSGGAE